VLERIERAISERDVVLIDVAIPVVRELLFNDPRYEHLQQEGETLLTDATLAAGDEDTDAHDVAKEIAAEMRLELSSVQPTVLKADARHTQ
jgi:hypothetical protein